MRLEQQTKPMKMLLTVSMLREIDLLLLAPFGFVIIQKQ